MRAFARRRRRPDRWTFAPLLAAVIIGSYFVFYFTFVECHNFLGGGCAPVSVRPLLEERKLCPLGSDNSGGQQAAATAAGEKPTPTPTSVPTPSVLVNTEGGGGAPHVTVLVTLPTPQAAPRRTPSETERRASGYAGRVSWTLLYAVGLVTSLVAVATSLYIIFWSLRESFRLRERVVLMLGLAVLLAAGLLALPGGKAEPKPGGQAAAKDGRAAARSEKEDVRREPLSSQLADCVLQADVARAPAFVRFGNRLGLFTAALLLAASCAVLWPLRKARALKTPGRAVAELAERMRLLRVILYVGMVALVVSVLRLGATFRWALSLLPPPDADPAVKIIEGITSNVTSAEATFYTLVLAAVYVPAALVLRRRARALITPGAGYTQALGDKWLDERGLNVAGSLKTLWPKLAAIVAPLVVGTAGDLFKGLGTIF